MTPDTPASAPDDRASSEESTDRSPVGHLVELCVYAPLGLALDARSLLPGLVERGRQQVGVARMVGEFAVKWGSVQLESKVGDAQEQAMGLLRATGLAPVDDRDRRAESTRTASDDASPTSDDTSPSDPLPSSPPTDLDLDIESDEPAIDVATLAIVDYDNLSASQVVPRLDGLTDEELEAVGRYEASRRGRNTILNKVAQLQSGE